MRLAEQHAGVFVCLLWNPECPIQDLIDGLVISLVPQYPLQVWLQKGCMLGCIDLPFIDGEERPFNFILIVLPLVVH